MLNLVWSSETCLRDKKRELLFAGFVLFQYFITKMLKNATCVNQNGDIQTFILKDNKKNLSVLTKVSQILTK